MCESSQGILQRIGVGVNVLLGRTCPVCQLASDQSNKRLDLFHCILLDGLFDKLGDEPWPRLALWWCCGVRCTCSSREKEDLRQFMWVREGADRTSAATLA